MSIESALEYVDRGWSVFPLLPKSKAPATQHGFKDAVRIPEDVHKLWGARTNLNIGITTGETFWVLDIDADKGGNESLEELENKYGSLPETLISNTGGGGRHYLFRIPKNITISSNAGKLAKGIDIRASGGYIAAPPSIHPNGKQYAWANEFDIVDAPKWLLKMILELAKKPTPQPSSYDRTASVPQGDWTTDDVISMLDCIPAIGTDDRQYWLNIGMALHDGGWPMSMWDCWSSQSPHYNKEGLLKSWKSFKAGDGVSFGTMVYLAEANGWKPKDKPYEALDLSNVKGVDLRGLNTSKKKIVTYSAVRYDQVKAPEKVLIGGLIGDTLTWINSTSFKLQPELSTMNIIAALGAVFGRRYALQKLNTRTNIYMVGIAETGQGKDNSRQRIKRLLRLSNLDQYAGPDEVRSGPGLLLELKKRPSFVANIDEIGMFMRALFDPKAPSYIREISSIFTKMYSCSGTSYEGGLIASMPDQRTVLSEPNLCLYGTTTLASYAEAMKKSAIASGELNRFIVLKSSIDFPEPNFDSDNCDPPETLISRWSQFCPEGWIANAPDIIEQEKTIVLLGAMAETVNDLYRYQDKMIKEFREDGLGALWVRYRENTLKVAMIVAIARDNKKPELIESDIEFGKNLVENSIRFMMSFAKNNMYDSDFQKKCGEFMAALKNGASTRTRMNLVLRIKPKELDEIERALRENEQIIYDEKERPKAYRVLQ